MTPESEKLIQHEDKLLSQVVSLRWMEKIASYVFFAANAILIGAIVWLSTTGQTRNNLDRAYILPIAELLGICFLSFFVMLCSRLQIRHAESVTMYRNVISEMESSQQARSTTISNRADAV